MTSSTFDLSIRAGDDHTFVVTWLPDGVATDLTGATAEMSIVWGRYPASGNVRVAAGRVDLTSGAGEIVIDAVANTVTVALEDATTELLGAPNARYQLRVDIDGAKTTIASGGVTVLGNLIDD